MECVTRESVMTEEPIVIRRRLVKAIKTIGYDVERFCEDYGVSKSIFYGSSHYPNTWVVIFVSNLTGISTDWLLKGKGENPDTKKPKKENKENGK